MIDISKYLMRVEKPARYIGGEFNIPNMAKPCDVRFCLCFPDVYEVGMSNIGIQIIYDIINNSDTFICERCFAPWVDFAKILRENKIPLKTENYAGKLHSKSMIIDDEYIILGSMNFSNSGENKNDENTVVISNAELSKHYKEFFMYLWNKIPDTYLTQNARPESKDSVGSCSDGIDNDFDGLIDSADTSCK